MKKLTLTLFLAAALLAGGVSVSKAQMKKAEFKPSDYTGTILKKDPSDGADIGNLFNMKMSQSYSMMFATYGGGHYANLNDFTNTMQFFFTDKLTGKVSLSLLHSPFGGAQSVLGKGNQVRFILKDAELNYHISKNASIHLQVSQYPRYGYGYDGYDNPFGGAYYGGFYPRGPFGR